MRNEILNICANHLLKCARNYKPHEGRRMSLSVGPMILGQKNKRIIRVGIGAVPVR